MPEELAQEMENPAKDPEQQVAARLSVVGLDWQMAAALPHAPVA
jgi:hypothetical protein